MVESVLTETSKRELPFKGEYYGGASLDILRDTLEERVDLAERGEVVLVLGEPQDYNDVVREVVQALVHRRGMRGVFISLDKPCTVLNRVLMDSGVTPDKITFIDASGGKNQQHDRNCKPAEPRNLTELSMELGRIFEGGEIDFTVLASLSTLRELNDRRSTVTFAHSLSLKTRDRNQILLMLTLRGLRSRTTLSVVPFCDRVIDLGSEALKEHMWRH
ncbi:MAG: hypothetical protein ACE5KH_02290 [Candidatus Geothermarchaeales archaeon]